MPSPAAPLRVAMWSGPRNISTAMMRSFGNRPDTFVTDEPLYAHYLVQTRLPHPGADETIATQENDWRKVVAWLAGPVPEGKGVWYQKHMAHHLLPQIETDWLDRVTNCFLIREPREMVTSLLEFIPHPTLRDTGLPQQWEIFQRVRDRTGKTPPVVDSADVLRDPRGVLTRLCKAVGIEFTDAMLSWPPGPRVTDGSWAKHWYAKVEQTTSFGPYRPKDVDVPASLVDLLSEGDAIYRRLHEFRL
jgi:hypothetical protein